MSETISNIKVNGTTYAINDSSKAGLEEVNELIEITTENKSSILSVNNKLDELLSKVESSGLDTSDATATAIDIIKDKTAYVNGEKITGTLEKKPDVDFSGASSDIADYLMVGYKAFDNEGILIRGEAENYTDQYSYLPVHTIISYGGDGSYGEILMTPTISNTAIVSNESMIYAQVEGLIPSNIKKDVIIGNLKGTYEGGPSVDISGVTAEAQYVLSGKKFVNSLGTLVTGTARDARDNYGRMEVISIDVNMGEINLKPLAALMPDGTAIITPQTTFFCSVSNILMGGVTVTPTKSLQTVSSRGKLFYDDITISPIPDEYITTTDATATAADITKDKTAYVNGQKITGTMEASSGDSNNGDMEFYECASVSAASGGSVESGNNIIVVSANTNWNTQELSEVEYLLGNYVCNDSLTGSSRKYILENPQKFSPAILFNDMMELWVLQQSVDTTGPGSFMDTIYQSDNNNIDASVEEIINSTWSHYNDADGAITHPNNAPIFNKMNGSDNGSSLPTWSGYKMEWREGSSSPAVSAIRISGTTNGVADGDYVSDTALTGADRKFINTNNSNAFIVWDGGDWALSLNGTNRVACTNTDGSGDLPTGSIEYICSVGFRVMLWGDGVIGSVGDAVSAEAVTIGGGGSPAGWYKTDTLTEELEAKGYYPVVGRIYNADTTVWARDLYVQQEGKMVLLLGFEKSGMGYMDETDTCFCYRTRGDHIAMTNKLFGDYAMDSMPGEYDHGIKTYDLPELDEFTLEYYFYPYYANTKFGGYGIIRMPVEGSKVEANLIPTKEDVSSIAKSQWHHCACVRRKGTGVVTVYLNGIKRMDIPFDKPIGGNRLVILANATNSCYADQYTIFNYAKYTSDFTPDYKEYLTIASGLNQTDYPTREVGVSGCACRFVNNKSYALMDSSATGTNRVWVSSDGKYYIRYEWETWYLSNSLGYSENAITYASLSVPMDPDTWIPLDIDPIGYPDWKDNFTQKPVSITYTGETSGGSDGGSDDGSATQAIGIRITSDGGSPIDGDYYPATGEKKFESASGQYFAITSGSWRICEASGYTWGSASGSEDDTIEELCSKSWYVEAYTCTLTPIYSGV